MICKRCQKRPAVVFVSRMEGDKTVNDGYCLVCAKELNIGPVNDMLEKFGISDEDLEQMDEQLGSMMNDMMGDGDGDGSFDPGGAATFPFFKGLFGGSANESGADVFLPEITKRLHQIIVKKTHQCIDLFGRTTPVFGRKSVNRQHLNADFVAVTGNNPKVLCSGTVPLHARHSALFGPAAVAVHNYSDMLRQYALLTHIMFSVSVVLLLRRIADK